jgi:hypothetical protein
MTLLLSIILYERSFSYHAPNKQQKLTIQHQPTDGAMVPDQQSAVEKVRPKKSYFSSAWEYVKLPFSTTVKKT